MPRDVRTLVNGFAKNPLIARREGLYFKEKDYKCIRADEYSLYAKNENTGVVVVKTQLYLLVATYTEGMYPSVCVEATEKLDPTGKFLIITENQPSIVVVAEAALRLRDSAPKTGRERRTARYRLEQRTGPARSKGRCAPQRTSGSSPLFDPVSSETMLAVYFDKPGGPENLYLKEVAKPSAGESEVLLKVAASALNRADLLQREGQYPPPPGASNILGLEASGHVAELGPGCQGHWKIGDPAMVLLPGGGQAQFVTVPEGLLMPIPAGLTMLQAAAIPEAWLTAFQLLHLLGNVQAGDSVLIHAGLSGVGTAAIQLARMAGAIPLVTAGSQHKLQMAEKLGAVAGFNYKEEDFSEAALKFTKDRQTVFRTKMASLCILYKQMLVKAFTEQILPHFSMKGPQRLLPVLDRIYLMNKIQEAHEYMETNKNVGKIVLEMPQ
ncbi:quinone oxidoreductase PIG3 [Camelus ferus]|nr:quinone oxidoreductase PIG3 [Camelus ferus]